ncbi:MAG TPA: DsbA family protein, partial [Kofleriaceae bacterium]|nr:DsbA family protein [Kofleriaceae bacterium]
MRLDFWFDLSCPYAYLASQRLGEVLSGRPVDLRYRPMLLGGVFREIGAGDGPMATLSDAKRANLARDLARWAAVAGVPLETPAAHPMRTVRALRTLLGLPEPSWPAATHALFAAYWQRGEDITQDEVIAAALTGAGVPATAVRSALAEADSDVRKRDLRARTDEAVALGVFGAPAFLVHAPPKEERRRILAELLS